MLTGRLDPLVGFPRSAAGCLCCGQFARPVWCHWERLEVVPDHGGHDATLGGKYDKLSVILCFYVYCAIFLLTCEWMRSWRSSPKRDEDYEDGPDRLGRCKVPRQYAVGPGKVTVWAKTLYFDDAWGVFFESLSVGPFHSLLKVSWGEWFSLCEAVTTRQPSGWSSPLEMPLKRFIQAS